MAPCTEFAVRLGLQGTPQTTQDLTFALPQNRCFHTTLLGPIPQRGYSFAAHWRRINKIVFRQKGTEVPSDALMYGLIRPNLTRSVNQSGGDNWSCVSEVEGRPPSPEFEKHTDT